MDRLLFVLLLTLAKGEEEATVETVRDDVETVGGVWGRVRDPESPLVHLQVRITGKMSRYCSKHQERLSYRVLAVSVAHRAMPVVGQHSSSSLVFPMLHLQSWRCASVLQHLP